MTMQQECIPAGCVPPTAVAVGVGGSQPVNSPWEQTPPGTMHPPGADTPRDHAPPQTHACKHITFPQTSFAGGKDPKVSVLQAN